MNNKLPHTITKNKTMSNNYNLSKNLKRTYLNFRIAFHKILAKWKQEQSVSETP